MGIFDSLHIGYSGLSTAQSGLNTTSHNISNANTEGYSKQSIQQKVNTPIHNLPGDVGAGTHVATITRSHDEFVYTRMKGSESNVSYSEYMEKTMNEISTFSPELDDLGIAKDFKDFFSAWSTVSQNPGEESSKVVLMRSMESLTQNLNESSTKLTKLQDRLNEEFKLGIDEVNKLAKEIVNINKSINKIESTGAANANDLRDSRDRLELKLAKMMNIEVSKGNTNLSSGSTAMTDRGTDYNINIGGFNIVDGATFHPLKVGDDINTSKLNQVFYTDHSTQKIDITSKIRGGTLGAILDLRGDKLDSNTGRASNSKIQEYLDDLNTLSKSFVQKVNSIYASGASEKILTDSFGDFSTDTQLTNFDSIKEGSFNIKIYDNLGNEVASRSITIDENTTLAKQDGAGDPLSTSILGQINTNNDDNSDNDGTNDLDDLFIADMVNGKLRILPKDSNTNYTISIEDNGTNFSGATGVNKLLTGDKASNISISSEIKNNPSSIKTNKAPVDGNSDLANDMVSLQYENLVFENPDGSTVEQSVEAYYRYSTSSIASDAHQATINKDAATVLNQAITDEFKSVSGVDMDEELINLMKYQTAYQANAKVITAVDMMLDTLLSMK